MGAKSPSRLSHFLLSFGICIEHKTKALQFQTLMSIAMMFERQLHSLADALKVRSYYDQSEGRKLISLRVLLFEIRGFLSYQQAVPVVHWYSGQIGMDGHWVKLTHDNFEWVRQLLATRARRSIGVYDSIQYPYSPEYGATPTHLTGEWSDFKNQFVWFSKGLTEVPEFFVICSFEGSVDFQTLLSEPEYSSGTTQSPEKKKKRVMFHLQKR